ncbi:MAG: hypothetical protein REI12_08395 [Pedobacter sp.]|nr:hypothetical protein [Pedobacter sp.]
MLQADKHTLNEPLTLQNEFGTGSLPKGTILYSMPQKGDEPMFFILVNTKNLESMKKYEGHESKNYLAAPISAYRAENP